MAEPEDARCSVSWSLRGDDPGLSFDEPFCISERGCDNLLRRLTASDADVDQLETLLETVRFDANKDEWRTLLRLDSVFATGVFDAGGALIGVTTCVRYRRVGDGETNAGETERGETGATRFGWCGNVVVHSAFRGRGVARMLLRAALEDVGADAEAWLDASDMGRPLYEKAGFEARSAVAAWTKTVRAADAVLETEDARGAPFSAEETLGARGGEKGRAAFFSGVLRAGDADAMRVLRRMDASVFGADREPLLRAWLASAEKAPGASFLDERVGYALAHRRGNATYLGPWGLADAPAAKAARSSASERASKNNTARASPDEQRAFVDAAVRRAVAAAARAALADGETHARVVAYVPEPLARSRRGEGRSADVSAGLFSEEDESTISVFAAGALMSDALARLGFARGDVTARMARRGARAERRAPGKPDRALTVASLDLG